MSGVRLRRREQTRQEILDAAWAVARDHGLAGLTMRDLGARVGMRAQSLYSYFPSKHAIYDAMFAEGNRELLARYRAMDTSGGDPRTLLRRTAEVHLRFCAEEPVRHQLLHLEASGALGDVDDLVHHGMQIHAPCLVFDRSPD